MLNFGILSGILILALLAFNVAKEKTEFNVVTLEAESVAQRVAGVVVGAALLYEQYDIQAYAREVQLPEQFEGRDYTITLAANTVTVAVPSMGVTVTEPLFSVGQIVELCSQTIGGGPLTVRLTDTPGAPDICGEPDEDALPYMVHLEET